LAAPRTTAADSRRREPAAVSRPGEAAAPAAPRYRFPGSPRAARSSGRTRAAVRRSGPHLPGPSGSPPLARITGTRRAADRPDGTTPSFLLWSTSPPRS